MRPILLLACPLLALAASEPPTLVSVSAGGGAADGASWAPQVSANGQHVAFTSAATNLVPGDTNGVADVFVRDLVAGTTRRVSVASSGAQAAADCLATGISADGRLVLFETAAALVADDTNGIADVYLHDVVSSTTSRVSVTSDGGQLDGSGRYGLGAFLS